MAIDLIIEEEEEDLKHIVIQENKEIDYIAFMCAAYHYNYDYLEQTLKEYPIGLYLIAAETTTESHKETDGQHFHFLVQMTESDYHKYAKRCFKDKLKLRGQARDGKARQYGKVKKIEDIERMAAYTIKQGNIRTNMTESQLETYKKITFSTKDEITFEDLLVEIEGLYEIVEVKGDFELKWLVEE